MCEVYDWDDFELSDIDEKEFKPLPSGTYDFKVVDFEKSNYVPGATSKTPACKQAIYNLEFHDEKGNTSRCKEYLPLAETMKWKIVKFFKAIGAPVKDGKVSINFNDVVGKTGTAKIKVGSSGKYNEIVEYIMPDDANNLFGKPKTSRKLDVIEEDDLGF